MYNDEGIDENKKAWELLKIENSPPTRPHPPHPPTNKPTTTTTHITPTKTKKVKLQYNHRCNTRQFFFDDEERDNGDDYDYDGSNGDHQYSGTDRPSVKNDGSTMIVPN